MRKVAYISVICNLIVLIAVALMLHKLGGISNVLFKLNHKHSLAKMEHRSSQFAHSPKSKGSIIFLGDSITEFGEWSELLPTHKILNRGIAGDGIQGVLRRLNELKRHEPNSIFLMIGINDLCFHTPKEVIQSYKDLINTMQIEFPSTQIVIQSILPVNNHIYKTGTDNLQIDEVNNAISTVCSNKGIDYIDLSSTFKDSNNRLKKAFTQDGIHINGIAYKAWRQSLNHWLPTE